MFKKYFCGDEDRKNDEDWLNKIEKSLDMNFISIKKHEMEILIFLELSHMAT